MSRRQAILLVLANAAISLVISIVVVSIALGRWEARQPAYPPLVVPTRPASPTPLTTDIIYVVQQGDSLSSIAHRFNIPIEDLMRANDLTDPDHIIAGRRLIIPSGHVRVPALTPTDTVLPFEPPTPVSVETPTGTSTRRAKATQKTLSPTPTNTATPPSVSIEIQSLTGAGDLPQETLLIFNAGDESVQLDGWTISDGTDNEYVFVDFTLQPGSGVSVHTGAGDDDADASDLYWGLDFALWIKGVTATLRDRDGGVVYQFSVE